MYSLLDILFAGLLFTIGSVIIVMLIISGSTINIATSYGIRDCIYKQIESNNLINMLLSNDFRLVEATIRSCGAEKAIIHVIQYESGTISETYYPPNNWNTIISRCTQYTTITLYFNTTNMERMYILIICIR